MLKSEPVVEGLWSVVMRYSLAVLSVALALIVTNLLSSYWRYNFPTAMFFPAIIITAWIGGWGPGLLSILLAFLSDSYFFPAPLNSLRMNSDEVTRIILFLISALSVSGLVVGQKKAKELLQKAREELREKEERLRLAVEAADIGTYLINLDTKRVQYSPNMKVILGVPPDFEPAMDESFLAVHPEDRPVAWKAFEAGLDPSGKGHISIDLRIVRPNGEVRWLTIKAQTEFRNMPSGLVPFRQVGVCFDITQRMLMAQTLQQINEELDIKVQERTTELRQSEEQFRLMVEGVQDYAIFMLDIDGNIKTWNIGAERITGYKASEIIGRHFSILYPSEEIESNGPMNRLRLAVAGGQSETEGWRLRKKGFRFYANAITAAIRDENGVLRGFSIVIRDLTEKRLADEKLKTLQGELAHMSRVMMMGELTASIAHEVNQPIGAIVNYGSTCRRLLAVGPEKLSEVDLALSCIIQDANRASAIITRIRGLLKKSEPEMGLLHFKNVVEDIMLLTNYELTIRGVTLRVEIPEDLPQIVGDRVQIQQVLMNLVINAMDAMSAEEERPRVIVIRGERQEEGERNPWVQISVRDSGIGLKGDNINQLFEAFYTTKPSGLGMGLAICQSIVEAHRGRLWAKQNAGPGLTFYFVLPSGKSKTA